MPKKRTRAQILRQGHAQAALTSLGELCRTPVASVMAWLMIAFALALPGVFGLLLKNIDALNNQWRATTPTISLYLRHGETDTQRVALQTQILARRDVQTLRYISPAQAWQQLQRVAQLDGVAQALTNNPLPAVLVVQPRKSAMSSVRLQQLKSGLQMLSGVDKVELDMTWVQRLLSVLQIGQRLLVYLSAMLAMGVVLIVGNTIRLSLLRHRREIDVLALIGATPSFIRRPFLYRGAWLGLGGGLLACVCLWGLMAVLGAPVADLASSYGSAYRLRGLSAGVAGEILLGSLLLGVLGARIACWRMRIKPELSRE